MAKIKLTKTVVGTARPQSHDAERRDTLVPGFEDAQACLPVDRQD